MDIRCTMAMALSVGLVMTGCSKGDEAGAMQAMEAPVSAVEAPPSPSMPMKAEAAPATDRAAPAAEAKASAGEAPASGPSYGSQTHRGPAAGLLTAGEWRDLDDWPFWLELLGANDETRAAHWAFGAYAQRWGMAGSRRIPISVRSQVGPVVDAQVTLVGAGGGTVWTARTDNRGQAELFTGFGEQSPSGPFSVRVNTRDGRTSILEGVQPGAAQRHVVELAAAPQPARVLDLMFVVDTTGSMGDELRFLQRELEDIVQRAQRHAGQSLSVRTSANFYRDKTDSYVVRSHPFTSDLATTLRHMRVEQANGGGDFPEAVDEALAAAVHEHEWAASATARLLFLVLDAPPHSDPTSKRRYLEAVQAAAGKGIRIIPVASSGIDKPTEFLLRASANSTGGTYTFLTDHSGIGSSHLKPTIGSYQVRPLNDLIVEIIERYVSVDPGDQAG